MQKAEMYRELKKKKAAEAENWARLSLKARSSSRCKVEPSKKALEAAWSPARKLWRRWRMRRRKLINSLHIYIRTTDARYGDAR
jgi:hypothetical protein